MEISLHKTISIHALREEGDLEKLLFCLADRLFLSTPSARRATTDADGDTLTVTEFLSTPSARRATVFFGWEDERV